MMTDNAGLTQDASDSENGVFTPTEQRIEKWRRRSGLIIAPVVFFGVWWISAGRLSPEAGKMSAVLLAALVMWMTEAVPLAVTAILSACLCVLLGVGEAKTVLMPFADPIIFLFIGSFMLARAMTIHQLDHRFALGILSFRWVRATPGRILLAVGGISVLISMWVSNTASAAMMLPVAVGLLRALEGAASAKSKNGASMFASGMMLIIAYGACVGGIGTPVGSPPNLIAIGMVRKLANVEISFFQWMALCVPLMIVMYMLLFVLLRWLHPAPAISANAEHLSNYLEEQKKQIGGWTRGQVNTCVAFGIAVVLWILPGVLSLLLGRAHVLTKLAETHLPESVVAVISACLLFVLPTDWKREKFTLSWKEAVKIDWGTILLFGGGLALGSLMFSTGVATIFGKWIMQVTGVHSQWSLTAMAIIMGIIISETTSNTASASMVIPVVISLSQAASVNPVPPALGACLGASFGFMLPVSTPPNAVVYGSGLVPVVRMIRAGILFDICGFFLIWGGLRILCPLMGL